MRRQRPATSRLCRDPEATALMGFKSRQSYVTFDGRTIYAGRDAEDAYQAAMAKWNGRCAICGEKVAPGLVEWDHIERKSLGRRNDHESNRQFVCGRWSKNQCHQKKHPRQLKWTPRTVAAAGGQ